MNPIMPQDMQQSLGQGKPIKLPNKPEELAKMPLAGQQPQQGLGQQPAAPGGPPTASAQPPQQSPADPNADPFDTANAGVNSLVKIKANVEKVKRQLDKLMKLGDSVTPDDIIEAMGTLVGSTGMDAMTAASMLADMPQAPGEALAGWVKDHDALVTQKALAIGPVLEAARHNTVVEGLQRLIQVHQVQRHVNAAAAQQPQQPPTGTPGGPPNG